MAEPDPEVPDPEDIDIEDLGDLEDPEDPATPGAEGEGGEEAEPAEPAEPVEPVEVIEFADHVAPGEKVVREAMEWAFEKEETTNVFIDQCVNHALLLYEGNRRMNLTKIVDPKELAAKHYLDCWRAMQLLPLLGRTVLDIGSGGGFPGIPIALGEPNTSVTLCDSTQKKADFIQHCIDSMGLKNAKVTSERAEEHLQRNRYDVVFMRAISSVRENVRLLRKVRHSLMDLVMMKGPSWSREVRAGEREAERLGFRLDTVWEHELPGELGGRAVLVYGAPGGQGR